MTDLSFKDSLLLSLVSAGHKESQDYALALVKRGENNNGTNANLSTAPAAQAPAPDAGDTDGQTGELQYDATQLDARGFPHCPTIHAKTKTKDTKGVWKYAVGIDRENLVPQIEQQLRDAGFGQPGGAAPATPAPEAVAPAATTQPVAATPPVAAPTPGLPPVAGAAPGLPPVAVQPPKVIEFPEAASEADMDEDTLIQTAAALAGKHGNDALKKLLALFQVPEGGSVKDIPEGWKFPFWQYATNDDGLRSQSVIS